MSPETIAAFSYRDPCRWAWWALVALAFVLFGSPALLDSSMSLGERVGTLAITCVIAAPLVVMTRSSVSVADGVVQITNQAKRYSIPVDQVAGLEMRRARLVYCAHLIVHDGGAIPVAALAEVRNRLTGHDLAGASEKSERLLQAIEDATRQGRSS